MSTETGFVYEGTIPARPDFAPEVVQAPAPRKPRRWLVWAAAGTIGLAIGGGLAATDSNEAPTTSTTTVEAPANTPDIAAAADQSATLIGQASDELDLAIAAGEAGDVTTMVSHVRSTAALWSQVSGVWVGIDPYLESTSLQIAEHIDRSADYVEAGDYTSASSEIEAGTALVQDITDYLDAGTVGGVTV